MLGSTSLPVTQTGKHIETSYTRQSDNREVPGRGLMIRTLLDDDGVQAQFHFGTFHDPFLNRVLGDETEHTHLLLLTDPVSTVLKNTRLHQRCWIKMCVCVLS